MDQSRFMMVFTTHRAGSLLLKYVGRAARVALPMLVVLAMTLAADPARGVIIIGSSAGNTSAPSDPSLGVRWNQVGSINAFMGTPIAPQFFLTAKHLGNLTGQAITFLDSTSYTTTARFVDPASDLAIYQISGTFPTDKIVPLYSGSFTNNQAMTIFGRGLSRTDTTVIGNNFPSGTEVKGWTWGANTGARSWGTNTLDALADGGLAGIQLAYDFDVSGGNDQGILSLNDSGGPVFMQESGEWRLAGINYAVQSIFNTTSSGTGIYAAIYDMGGLYASASINGPWSYDSPTIQNQPASSYSSSVPANSTWIEGVIAVPEPSTYVLLAVATAAAGFSTRWRVAT
jgi:hypothetical protein